MGSVAWKRTCVRSKAYDKTMCRIKANKEWGKQGTTQQDVDNAIHIQATSTLSRVFATTMAASSCFIHRFYGEMAIKVDYLVYVSVIADDLRGHCLFYPTFHLSCLDGLRTVLGHHSHFHLENMKIACPSGPPIPGAMNTITQRSKTGVS